MPSMNVADTVFGAFLALDALSCALSLLVALFFWRSHRLAPSQGYSVLALAFVVLGASFLSVAVSQFDRLPNAFVVDAFRVGGQFLGALLIFLNYALRGPGRSVRSLHVATAGLSGLAALYLVLYFAVPPFIALPDPESYRPWVRLVEFGLLLAASYMVAVRIGGTRLSDYRVPLAFLLLAVSKYSWGLLGIYGVDEAVAVPYAWRVAGLLLLIAALAPLRGWPDASS